MLASQRRREDSTQNRMAFEVYINYYKNYCIIYLILFYNDRSDKTGNSDHERITINLIVAKLFFSCK